MGGASWNWWARGSAPSHPISQPRDPCHPPQGPRVPASRAPGPPRTLCRAAPRCPSQFSQRAAQYRSRTAPESPGAQPRSTLLPRSSSPGLSLPCFLQTHFRISPPSTPFCLPSPSTGPRPERRAALHLLPLPALAPSFPSSPRAHGSSIVSKCPRPGFPLSAPNPLSLGPPRPPPSTGAIRGTETVTLSAVAYLSCPPPGHQLRPQGPGPGPELPAGAGTAGPCSGWWRDLRRKDEVRPQDGLPRAPNHIQLDSRMSWPRSPLFPPHVNSLVSDPISPLGGSSLEPRPGSSRELAA